MAKTTRTEPITHRGVSRELSLLMDKHRLDSATRVTVYIGAPVNPAEPEEKRFFLPAFGCHVGVFLPVEDAARKAGK